MKTSFSQFLSESTFDFMFSIDTDVEYAQLHHNEWCSDGNFVNAADADDVARFIEETEHNPPGGFVAFDKIVTGPDPRNNALDFEPKATVYFKGLPRHLEEDLFKKLEKFLRMKNLSTFVEPFYI